MKTFREYFNSSIVLEKTNPMNKDNFILGKRATQYYNEKENEFGGIGFDVEEKYNNIPLTYVNHKNEVVLFPIGSKIYIIKHGSSSPQIKTFSNYTGNTVEFKFVDPQNGKGGYVRLTSILKPFRAEHYRVKSGNSSQKNASEVLKQIYGKFITIEDKDIAPPGSTKPDIIALPTTIVHSIIGGQRIIFEVKGCSKFSHTQTLFDKTTPNIGPPSYSNEQTAFADTYVSIVTSNPRYKTFGKYIEDYRKIDNSYGFNGQPGVKTSGGVIPTELTNSNKTPHELSAIYRRILYPHLDGKFPVNYLLLYNRSETNPTDRIKIYYTKIGKNILASFSGDDALPIHILDETALRGAGIKTYSSDTPQNTLRIGFKVLFK